MISLHTHSEWSCLDGLSSISALVSKAKEYGMKGLAITDHGTCSSHFKFYEECKKQGINPILGEEFYIANRKMTDRDPQFDKKRFHLTVLAMNMTGLRNLWKLSSLAYTDGFYYKPRIDEETLFKYSDGLIVLSGCHSSKISQYLIGDEDCPQDVERAYKIANAFKQKLGNRFRLEIQCHGLKGSPKPWSEQIKLNKAIIEMGKKLDIKVCLTADSHYIDPEDVETHEVLLCIGTQNDYDDKERWSLRDWDLSFPNPEKIEKWLLDEYGSTEYMDNTDEINDMVNIEWEYGKYLIPKFDTGSDTEYDYLKKLAWAGLKKKCPDHVNDKEYLDRFKFELDTLNQMGYLGYFLIVQEYVNWAKDNGIGVGPSRGSCAGSLLAYLLNIIEVNPMEVGTLFERFINPERPTAPDIDVDFEDARRIEVVQHVTEKYGKDCVCNILILNYLKTKSAFKDVARVFKLPFKEANDISALIPQDKPAEHHKLIDALDVPEIKSLYDKSDKVKTVFDYALKLEGKPRNHGVHACGVIIAPEPLTNYIPLEIDKDGKIVSQFPPEDLEKLGLLKMDFLGLSTISIIQNTLKYIPELNTFYDIPVDDEETYKTFKTGKSYMTFQFNTRLARETCVKMQPNNIMELSDVTAIARPGPMEQIPHYQHRKDGTEKVSYINKWAEKYFGTTYGINVYQEQGMQYLQEAAGFSKAQADFWRKGVAKAKMDILEDLKPKYMEGSKKNGIPEAQAEKWWNDQIEGGAYTFNLAHSYAYAYIGYITCYLLTHYPVEYMTAVMNNWADDKDKLNECFAVCKELGISILPPDIKVSGMNFTPKGKNIVYGISAVKGLGKQADVILENTRKNNFEKIEDFLLGIERRILNKTKLYGLICSGALDSFGYERIALIDAFDDILAWRDEALKPLTATQVKNGEKKIIPKFPVKDKVPTPSDNIRKFRLERESTGSYVSGHPLELYNCELPQKRILENRKDKYGKDSKCVVNIYGVADSVEVKTYSNKSYKTISFDIGDKILVLSVNEGEPAFMMKEGNIYRVNIFAKPTKRGSFRVQECNDVTPFDVKL